MIEKYNGYVIYCKDKKIPLGIVSSDYDCKAECDYVPTQLKRFLVEIEDRRFFNHSGIDYRSISRALIENIKAGCVVQGGSTITQQLARNLLRDNSKTVMRKIRESLRAIQIESHYSKEEILLLYFNNIYFGKNIWGLRAAGLYYFKKEIEKLSQPELLYLLTILRGPNFYAMKVDRALSRYNTLNTVLFERRIISKNRYNKNAKKNLVVTPTHLASIQNDTVPYITKKIDIKRKTITSSIDLKIQNWVTSFVSDSKYPVSVVALHRGKVIGFASSYGTDYLFKSKSNVGSTIKPFLYCYLRSQGITEFDKFSSTTNSLSWNVREVGFYKSQLTIQEALFYSNNNAFVNASSKIGIESSLKFLSDTFKKSESDFFASSILGATSCGISLYELALAYSNFFSPLGMSPVKQECLTILNHIFFDKLGHRIENAFLKTGTTNDNKERFAILGDPDLTFGFLRNENLINDKSKEGGFMNQIARNISSVFSKNDDFLWI